MSGTEAWSNLLASGTGLIRVRVDRALGSTPREAGAEMLVSLETSAGTIGGGQLEYIALAHARGLLREEEKPDRVDVPLGPDIGQCCGGNVSVTFERLSSRSVEALRRKSVDAENKCPEVLVFGAGHVGKALAGILATLPVRANIIDTRREELKNLPAGIRSTVSALPESEVRHARRGSAFVVLTHDHALDFLIMREVLLRGDAAYAGMIGSRTKRTKFRSWFLKNGGQPRQLDHLVSPIGSDGLGDKRPEIIALFTASEIMKNIGQHHCPTGRNDANLQAQSRALI